MSLRYIAASLGLSVTTVSRALAGYSDVAEDTRRRVRAEADRIGYVPNAIARRLQKGRTDAIGVVAPSGQEAVTDAYIHAALTAAWSRLSEFDRDLLLLPFQSLVGRGNETGGLRRAVEERRVDGLLLFRTRRDDWRIPYLVEAKIPFVVCGAEHPEAPDVTTIAPDDTEACETVLERLAGFGHRRVVLVVPEGGFAFADTRIETFRRGARDVRIDIEIATAAFCEDGGRATTARLLAECDHPTAFVYFANRIALGGLRAIADAGLIPGRQVSVVSFGDNANLLYASPPITAVQAPIEAMARHAVDVLIGAIDGKPIEAVRLWPTTLVRRQSDGPLVARQVRLA